MNDETEKSVEELRKEWIAANDAAVAAADAVAVANNYAIAAVDAAAAAYIKYKDALKKVKQ